MKHNNPFANKALRDKLIADMSNKLQGKLNQLHDMMEKLGVMGITVAIENGEMAITSNVPNYSDSLKEQKLNEKQAMIAILKQALSAIERDKGTTVDRGKEIA